MKTIAVLILLISIFHAPYCRAEKLVVYQDGSNVIHGNLPKSWTPMTEEDVRALSGMDEQLDSSKIEILSGYRLATPENSGALLIVFYVNRSERVSLEQRQKIFNWFKVNRDLMSGLLPENIKEFTLEDIEYLQRRDTVLFESKVTVDGMELRGVNGIVFLRKGYLNISGFAADSSTRELNDFYSFIKTLEISPPLQYSPKQISFLDDYQWLQDHWQQILGGAIFLLIYGFAFLHRDKKRLVT